MASLKIPVQKNKKNKEPNCSFIAIARTPNCPIIHGEVKCIYVKSEATLAPERGPGHAAERIHRHARAVLHVRVVELVVGLCQGLLLLPVLQRHDADVAGDTERRTNDARAAGASTRTGSGTGTSHRRASRIWSTPYPMAVLAWRSRWLRSTGS